MTRRSAHARPAICAFLIVFSAVGAQAQNPLLWGELEAGSYGIGYRTFFAVDESREYGGGRGRPILFRVWYPAASADGAKLTYEAYFEVPPLNSHPLLSHRLRSLARDVTCNDLFNRQSESLLRAPERKAFQRLLSTHTAAVLDAREAPGAFPVVLYHPGAGGSFEENSLLFEYLASAGYIVVSSAFQSPFADSVSNNVGGIERSGPDMAFIANQARGWTNANPRRLAAIGHSAGAQAILQWIGSSESPVSAAVSLDSTLEYDEFLHFHRSLLAAFEKLTPPRIPVMLFARLIPKPGFSAFRNYLRFAPRYEVEAAGLKHDDFLTHGFLKLALKESRRSVTVRRAYEEVCRTVKRFLDSSLKDSAIGDSFLSGRAAGSPLSVRHKPPLTQVLP
jgi:dienelactone hydrolase